MSVTIEVPFNSIPYQNVDQETLDRFSKALFDGYIDELGNTNRRPGLSPFVKFGTAKPMDASFWWEKKQFQIFNSDGSTKKMINNVGTLVDLTGDKLEESGRVSYADNGDFLVMANGGKMVFTDSTALTAFITDADAPTEVTHVAYLDFFILAFQKGTSKVQFADFEGSAPTTWSAIDFFNAEASPDGLQALYVVRRLIYLMGSTTIEIWANDGVSPFSRLNGLTIQRGVIGPHATAIVNESLYFIDSNRRLTVLTGSTATVINTSFDRVLQSFDTISDVLVDYTTVVGKNWLVFSFPTEDRTLFYDLDGPGTAYWAEWSFFDTSTQTRKRFLGNHIAYARGFNQHFVGSFQDDQIFLLDTDISNDNNRAMHTSRSTGWLDHGTPDKLKRSYRLKGRIKSGIGIGTSNGTKATARIRFRDDGNLQFGNYINIDLGKQGESNFLKEINTGGSYYAREYEISCTDNVPFTIGKFFERCGFKGFSVFCNLCHKLIKSWTCFSGC